MTLLDCAYICTKDCRVLHEYKPADSMLQHALHCFKSLLHVSADAFIFTPSILALRM